MEEHFKVQKGELVLKRKGGVSITRNGKLVVRFGSRCLEVSPRSMRLDGKLVSPEDLRFSTDSIHLDG